MVFSGTIVVTWSYRSFLYWLPLMAEEVMKRYRLGPAAHAYHRALTPRLDIGEECGWDGEHREKNQMSVM